jgi:hypothetical protein
MTTWRQIAANRRNSVKSTGPQTEAGKRRSRRNALRHGLCAETVVEFIEDVEDYRAFEIAIASEYDARSVVERELVLRLASLLWRIRRATGIETALLALEAENAQGRSPPPGPLDAKESRRSAKLDALEPAECVSSCAATEDHDDTEEQTCAERERLASPSFQISLRALTHCFRALANADDRVFEKLGRYEAALWRQVVQVLFALHGARRRFEPALANRDRARE